MKFGSFHASNERINFDPSRILDISVCFRPESQKSPHVFLSIENISNESLKKFIKEARRTDKEISKRILRPLLTTILLNTSIIRSRNTTTHRVLFLRLLDSSSTVKFFKSASLRHCRFLSSSNPSPSFVPPWSVSHDVYIYIYLGREGLDGGE